LALSRFKDPWGRPASARARAIRSLGGADLIREPPGNEHLRQEPAVAMTFEALGKLPYKDVQAAFLAGKPVDVESLIGWEFRGWNVFPHILAKGIARIAKAQRFAKGFFRFPGEQDVYGYNIDIIPDGIDQPWTERMVNGAPLRRRFYRVHGPNQGANRGGRFPESLFFDYSEGRPRAGYFSGGGLRDFLVQAEPGNPDLLVLKAFQVVGPVWAQGGMGVLQRWRKYDYKPASN
jgi:hypothetical protein